MAMTMPITLAMVTAVTTGPALRAWGHRWPQVFSMVVLPQLRWQMVQAALPPSLAVALAIAFLAKHGRPDQLFELGVAAWR